MDILINEVKKDKKPMHIIMEEEENMEESPPPSPLGSDTEEFKDGVDEDQSMSLNKTPSLNTSSISSPMNNTPLLSYAEPSQKDGHVLFSGMRNDVMKAIPVKGSTKPDIYLDKVTFIGRRMVNIWFGKDISLEHFNMFIDLLKDKNYLLSFPIMVEGFRKERLFQIPENSYKPFSELLLVCLTEVSSGSKPQSLINKSVSIPLNLLNIGSTYHTVDAAGNNVFLIDVIRNHQIFKDLKFWEACILYKNLSMKGTDDGKTKSSTAFLSDVVNNILGLAFYMKDIFKEKQIIKELCLKYLKAYKIPEKSASNLMDFLNSK